MISNLKVIDHIRLGFAVTARRRSVGSDVAYDAAVIVLAGIEECDA